MTLLATLTPAGIGPAVAIPGAVDGAAFVAYAERILAPSLRPGQVVILDNLSAHKSEGARTPSRPLGPSALPAALLARLQPDRAGICQGQGSACVPPPSAPLRAWLPPPPAAIDAVSTTDARGFYAHCGFPLPAD